MIECPECHEDCIETQNTDSLQFCQNCGMVNSKNIDILVTETNKTKTSIYCTKATKTITKNKNTISQKISKSVDTILKKLKFSNFFEMRSQAVETCLNYFDQAGSKKARWDEYIVYGVVFIVANRNNEKCIFEEMAGTLSISLKKLKLVYIL